MASMIMISTASLFVLVTLCKAVPVLLRIDLPVTEMVDELWTADRRFLTDGWVEGPVTAHRARIEAENYQIFVGPYSYP